MNERVLEAMTMVMETRPCLKAWRSEELVGLMGRKIYVWGQMKPVPAEKFLAC